MPLDETLTQLTEDLAKANAEITRLKQEIVDLNIEAANKIASAKVDFETKEIDYKKKIKELTLALELRNSNERGKEREAAAKGKSVNALWDEVTGKSQGE